MILEAFELNPRDKVGGNFPPEPMPEPEVVAPRAPEHPDPPASYKAIKVHCDDLDTEARNWLDGKSIENQEQADEVAKLLGMFLGAKNTADEARKKEAEPVDKVKAEIQTRYNGLIGENKTVTGSVVRAINACRAALAPWLQKLEDEKRAKEAALQAEAAEKAKAAADAARAASGHDLEAQEAAEALVKDAQETQRAANRASNDRARASGGGYRAVSLRSVWNPTLTDAGKALKHYAEKRPDELKAFLLELAEQDVRAGLRTIPGFSVDESKVV